MCIKNITKVLDARAQVAKIMKVLNEREFLSKITMGQKRASGVSCNKNSKTCKTTDRQFWLTFAWNYRRPKKIFALATVRPQIMKECTLRTLSRLKMVRKQMWRRLRRLQLKKEHMLRTLCNPFVMFVM